MEQTVSEVQPVQDMQQLNPAQVQKPKSGNKLPLIIIIVLLLAIIIGGGIFAFTQLNNQNNKKEEEKTQEESKDDSKKEESEEFTKEDAKQFVDDLFSEFSTVENAVPTGSDLGTLDEDASKEEVNEYLENTEVLMNEAISAIQKSRPKILALANNDDTKKLVESVVNIYDFLVDYYKEYLIIANEYKEDEIDLEEFTKKSSDFLEEKEVEMDELGSAFESAGEAFTKKFGIELGEGEEDQMIDEDSNKDEMEDSELDDSTSTIDDEYEFSEEELDEFLKELENYQY